MDKVYCSNCTHYRVWKIGEYTGRKITACIHPDNVEYSNLGYVEDKQYASPGYGFNMDGECSKYKEFKGWIKFPVWLNGVNKDTILHGGII